METANTNLKATDAFKVDGSHVIVHERLIMFPFLEQGRRMRCGTPETADYTQKMLMAAYNAGSALSPTESWAVRAGSAAAPAKKSKRNPSRADRGSEISGTLESAQGDIEMLKEELESWLENMPENLQETPKAEELQEAIDGLESAAQDVENAKDTLDGVQFPGMF